MGLEQFKYDNKIVKYFLIATIIWGVVGMLMGVLVAHQIYIPAVNLNFSMTTFGRTRPIHTNAIIFAFVGNGMFTGIYYSMQRILKARCFSDKLSWFNFWGWQTIIVAAAVTLSLGFTTSKEYAELEWPIDIMIAVVWLSFGANMIGTILKRRERHLYVAIWFYIATFVTVTVLHVVNSISMPVSLFKSYPVYAGVQDALIQWWYGHNAVAFFLTTPYLGLMYYYLPKAANRPVYSYRLSIIHFWALIFIYIWAGPHHLLFTALPGWTQALGVVFSVMLIAPSWGGMLNGLLTLRGAWDKVREDPVLKFLVVAVTCYGMATFEGPMMSIKSVNAISHYTDWTIGHVHIGGLGWNGFLTFGMLYWLVPKLWQTKLYSTKLANAHFWVGTIGIVFYAVPLYFAGFTQSLMWKQFTEAGMLKYPNFLDTVTQIKPMYMLRGIGGTIFFLGTFIMIYNLWKTAKQGEFLAEEEAEAMALEGPQPKVHGHWHRWIESRSLKLTGLALVAILIGGMIEIIPMFAIKSNIPTIASVTPYTPLELEGRDIYIREGCNTCHSQMIRPFRNETERYGEYSKPGEFVYDHPFLWGSKRTGPDLAREGGQKLRKSNSWHYLHMLNPRGPSPGSIMPAYPWLLKNELNTGQTAKKIKVMRTLGVPYADGYEDIAVDDLRAQAEIITADLAKDGIETVSDREIIALIAYLQRLGSDIEKQVVEEK
ncbi:MAG: cytochrome-c oxidase, cbb3-type subunit I [Bacteroidetes bacterium]|nr:cytochrome-c oxidase, cbb3-type subunit I [Bacteroidota bacterium]